MHNEVAFIKTVTNGDYFSSFPYCYYYGYYLWLKLAIKDSFFFLHLKQTLNGFIFLLKVFSPSPQTSWCLQT